MSGMDLSTRELVQVGTVELVLRTRGRFHLEVRVAPMLGEPENVVVTVLSYPRRGAVTYSFEVKASRSETGSMASMASMRATMRRKSLQTPPVASR